MLELKIKSIKKAVRTYNVDVKGDKLTANPFVYGYVYEGIFACKFTEEKV